MNINMGINKTRSPPTNSVQVCPPLLRNADTSIDINVNMNIDMDITINQPPKKLRVGLPPPPEKDEYLASRLDRFYSDIQAYKPGAIPGHSDYNEDQARSRRRDRDDHNDQEYSRKNFYGTTKERKEGMQEDGSFAGPKASQYAGLGAASLYPSQKGERQSDDVYSSYRKSRSYTYHDGSFKAAANMYMPRDNKR
eukprot:gene28115-31228_t